MLEKDEDMKEAILQDILMHGEKISIEETIKKAIEYKARILEFTEPDPNDMLDVAEEEEIQTDTLLFRKYNEGIEKIFQADVYAYESYDNAIKFMYKNKEIVLGFSCVMDYSRRQYNNSYYELTFLMEVESKKRLFVQSGNYLFKSTQYDRCFLDYVKSLDEYDQNNDEEFKEYFSDRMMKWKEKNELNLEKYELSDGDKEFLKDIFVTYNIPIDFVLKDGYLCITTSFDYGFDYKKDVKKICELIDAMFKVFERFMYMV